jgi:hypothetical protein
MENISQGTFPQHTTVELETVETPISAISGADETKYAEDNQPDNSGSDSDSETEEQATNRKNNLDTLMEQIATLRNCPDFDKLPIPYNYKLIYDCLYGYKDPMEHHHKLTREEILYYNKKAKELNDKYALQEQLNKDRLSSPWKKN